MIDADGAPLGVYRKSWDIHPRRAGLMEKYYFRPGDTGFKVWDTRFSRVGAGICWDQWYLECGPGHDADGGGGAALPHGHRFGAA